MRRPFLSLGLFAILSAGCDRLDTDPIFAYGRASNRDGTPLAGATLVYERARQVEPTYGVPPLVFPVPEFQPYGTATTEASGDFFLEMRFGDVQALQPEEPEWNRQPYRYRVSRLEEDGAGTFVSFLFYDDVELPELRPWDARLTVAPGAGGHVVSFEPAPPPAQVPVTGEDMNTLHMEVGGEQVPLSPMAPEPVLLVTSGGKTVYRWWGAASPWTASPYILEDFASPEVQLRAMAVGEWLFRPLAAAHSYLDFRVEWRTGHQPLPAGSLRPVSRGASCSPLPAGATECPWTDGKLEQVTGVAGGVKVMLPEPRRLRHAVVRGMGGVHGHSFRLEGSLDGEQWSLLAESPLLVSEEQLFTAHGLQFDERTQWDSPFDGPLDRGLEGHFGEAPLADVGPVRFVRLFSADYTNGNNGYPRPVSTLSELSLFE
ncbi:hypothetical protein ACLESO_02660 [Pyxidicoccus sp. 3LG]